MNFLGMLTHAKNHIASGRPFKCTLGCVRWYEQDEMQMIEHFKLVHDITNVRLSELMVLMFHGICVYLTSSYFFHLGLP